MNASERIAALQTLADFYEETGDKWKAGMIRAVLTSEEGKPRQPSKRVKYAGVHDWIPMTYFNDRPVTWRCSRCRDVRRRVGNTSEFSTGATIRRLAGRCRGVLFTVPSVFSRDNEED